MKLNLHIVDSGSTIEFVPEALIVAGFTGRNRKKLDAHLRELALQGIRAPANVPTFYEVPLQLLSTDEEIHVTSRHTSGEVEPVLFCTPGSWYLGIGSDHTARDIERQDIAESKRVCAKVISSRAFLYETVVPRWDEIVIRSWAGVGGTLYQEAKLAMIAPPNDLVAGAYRHLGNTPKSIVVFLGTVPLCSGQFEFSSTFKAELEVPQIEEKLRIHYRVAVTEERK